MEKPLESESTQLQPEPQLQIQNDPIIPDTDQNLNPVKILKNPINPLAFVGIVISIFLMVFGAYNFYKNSQNDIETATPTPSSIQDNSEEIIIISSNIKIKSILDDINKILMDFSNQTDGEINAANDGRVWWVDADGRNINNENSSIIKLDFSQGTEWDDNSLIENDLLPKIIEIFIKNNFKLNKNTRYDYEYDEFNNHYKKIYSYEKGDAKCNIYLLDVSNTPERIMSVRIACTDRFQENYEKQIPFLKAADIKSGFIESMAEVGSFFELNIRSLDGSGSYLVAKKEGNEIIIIGGGQELLPCSIVKEYKVPKKIAPTCLDYKSNDPTDYEEIENKNINTDLKADITSERRDGPTPNGGAYSIVYYLDDGGNPAGKDEASSTEIAEFDSEGNEIFRTYGNLE